MRLFYREGVGRGYLQYRNNGEEASVECFPVASRHSPGRAIGNTSI